MLRREAHQLQHLVCNIEQTQRVNSVSPLLGRSLLMEARVDKFLHHHNLENFRKHLDVAPSFYPATIGVWSSVMPCWAVVAAVRGAKPSVERSAADRRAAA